MNPFSKNNSPANSPDRNTFDLSHQVNSTYNFGYLYPFQVTPVIPGDTAKIDVAFGLRAMPTAFPVQTKIRVDAHYFYVRNRNLWKDWPNFIGKTGSNNYDLPYIAPENMSGMFKSGSLSDHLGIPTTVVGDIEDNLSFMEPGLAYDGTQSGVINMDWAEFGSALTSDVLMSRRYVDTNQKNPLQPIGSLIAFSLARHRFYVHDRDVKFELSIQDSVLAAMDKAVMYWYLCLDSPTPGSQANTYTVVPGIAPFSVIVSDSVKEGYKKLTLTGHLSNPSRDLDPDRLCLCCFTGVEQSAGMSELVFPVSLTENFNLSTLDTVSVYINEEADLTSFDFESLPKISALPFRAYESIYNSFYRDQRNNPYIVDGIQDPNVYLPSTAGGEDSYIYALRRRNWEQDFITTAVPTPQQGKAPLVGITSYGDATFLSDDGTEHTVKLTTDDGDHVTGATYTSNIPNDVARSLVNLASSGFSISDFRGVNALQRWLEINMRRGLKYKDQIKSHFGVEVSYAELDMPEFIGGFTKWFDTTQVNQTAQMDGDPLGSYAGQLSAVGGTEGSIQHYCDEHGYIIGIVSITPVPVYSQLLPKDYIKREALDYYFPEFGHLGFQPVTYNEVCPLQAILAGVDTNSVFGYQRPWYDYLAETDKVHGLFRTYLSDFVLSRKFMNIPSLNPDFLTVDPDQLNEIFTVKEDAAGNPLDPFLGQIHIKCLMKRPIPRFAIPGL